MFLFVLILCGALCASWTWRPVSILWLVIFLAIISSNIFFAFFSFFLPYSVNISICLILSQRSLKLCSCLKLFLLLVQFSSVAQSCPTLCVHRLSDAIQLSHPLSSPSPPAFNPSQHQGLFQSWLSASSGPSIGASDSTTILAVNIQC